MTDGVRWTAIELAAALEVHAPTAQQAAIIEAPPDRAALVVAGAGSGKTETMSLRVAWLVANGFALPGEVLGLTFTRKAAGELSERMAKRVASLRERGLVPARDAAVVDPAAALLDTPRVSTYNAFAATLFRENASLMGFDGDSVVLGEASAWLLARRIVLDSDDERLPLLDDSLDTIANAVLRISSALSENLAEADAVAGYAEEMLALSELAPGGSGAYAGVETDVVDRMRALPLLLDLARRYQEAKAARGFSQFSDQIATALRIVERHPGVARQLRAQYRFVILDEYQDTSVSQSRLLSTVFRGHPVMAVGDPHQSIYGWRGASASNLAEFGSWFDSSLELSLSTSWRNGVHILRAANRLIEPLTAVSPVHVEPLEPRPDADAVPVSVAYAETVTEEASAVAAWFAERLSDPALARTPTDGGEPQPPTAALLLRARSTLEHFLEAFRRAKVPYHVLGVGGLLAEPIVADLVAALAVVARADAGSELIRLLVGSRWRIGAHDIVTLRALAGWLERRDLSQREFDETVREVLRASVVAEESASIVDALDFLAHAPADHRLVASLGFSEAGLARLREAGTLFAELRRRIRLPVSELSTIVLEVLGLDIEAAANESRPASSRALEGFFEAVASFEQLGHGASIAEFLGWLREAETRDRLTPRSDPPEPGWVQILTIHGAKGLEWDLVAVPRLVQGELPNPSATSTAWLTFGGFPYDFRGDAAALPEFRWREATTRKEVLDELKDFKARVKLHLLREDRRLAYVAVTRARSRLLLSGSFWSTQKACRPPSEFLVELADSGIIAELPAAPASDSNPIDLSAEVFSWPRDPLGDRRARVIRAADEVRAADPAAVGGALGREVALLLDEQRRRTDGSAAVSPPARIPASRFAEFVFDPEGSLGALRRPMPEKPYRATRLGTLFHSWVEARSLGAATEFDDLDADAFDLDGQEFVAIDADRLAELQATFERSPWATLKPIEVEREIQLPFDGRVVICKIDAVYQRGERVEIVDWKTGKAPVDDADIERKQLQLALYRLAYSRWKGVDPSLIDAVFYFVADDREIRPPHIDTEQELLARWRAAFP